LIISKVGDLKPETLKKIIDAVVNLLTHPLTQSTPPKN
jgi:hypothetical protein